MSHEHGREFEERAHEHRAEGGREHVREYEPRHHGGHRHENQHHHHHHSSEVPAQASSLRGSDADGSGAVREPPAGRTAAAQPPVTAPPPRVRFSIDRRTLQLAGGGALGALGFLALAHYSPRLKPALTAALKEVFGMKEWLLGKTEGFSADLQDAIAEAKHGSERDRDLEKILEGLADDESLQQKVRDILRERARRQP